MTKIGKHELDDALREMGPKYLKERYRERWTPERPTTGYCYVVSEVLYHYEAPEGSKPYVVRMHDGNETHWFLKDPKGRVIDFTADQYDEPVPYDKGKPCAFLTKQLSKRGRVLADLLGLDDASQYREMPRAKH